MKLRIKGNSVRIRLDRRDLAQLVEDGHVDDAVQFGPGPHGTLSYTVAVGQAPRTRPQLHYSPGQIVLEIARDDVEDWHRTDRVGFEHLQDCGGEAVRVLLEKDFACADRPTGDAGEDALAFPNPSLLC